jgi:hypothetical protein
MSVFFSEFVFHDRPEWGVFVHIFPDSCLWSAERGMTDFNGWKTGLFKPVWLADQLFRQAEEDEVVRPALRFSPFKLDCLSSSYIPGYFPEEREKKKNSLFEYSDYSVDHRFNCLIPEVASPV